MGINTSAINSDVVNNGYTASASVLLSIEKNVESYYTSSGLILGIEKQINNEVASSILLSIEKRIVNAASLNTFFDRNSWEPIITLGAQTIDASLLTGEVVVVKQVDDNHTAQFTLLMPPDVYNLYNYQGAAVTISIRTGNTVKRVFTGFVDIPVVDVLNEKLTLSCIADRRKLLQTNASIEPYIGVYSETVLGENPDIYNKINARLQTVTADLDFDSYNIPTLTDWVPKVTPDFSYGSSDVFRRDPQLQIEASGKVVNQVNLTMNYGYQRCHHRQLIYFWTHPYAPLNPSTGEGGICAFLEDRPSMPTKEMITTAASATGWPCTSFYFGKQFKSGSYRCTNAWVQWSTLETGYLNAPIVDSNGVAQLDASGNPLTRSVQTVLADNTNLYTMNAQWIASKRFNQNIQESYSIVLNATASQATYGVLPNTESYSFTDPNTQVEWENYPSYLGHPTGVTIHSTQALSDSYYFDADQSRANFKLDYQCALYKARATILRSHRDTTIKFQREITPEIELKHTVELTGKWVRGKAKARRIEHHMSISDSSSGAAGEAWTQVELSQYRGITTVAETPLVPSAGFSDSMQWVGGAPILGTHLGVNPDNAGSEFWTGYVGNIQTRVPIPSSGSVFQQYDNVRTNYQESFIVETPDIDDAFRNNRDLTKSVGYVVNIPQDGTEYESYG